MSVRFVAVWTLQNGVLRKPMVLDDANQWQAFSAWRMDMSRAERARWEMGEQVTWSGPEMARKARA